MELRDLPNVGKVTEEGLKQAGISTVEELHAAGAEEAWLRLRADDPGVCLNVLHVLEGAIQGIPKRQLSDQRKQELKTFFDAEK